MYQNRRTQSIWKLTYNLIYPMDLSLSFLQKYSITFESCIPIGKGLNRSASLIVGSGKKYVLKTHKLSRQFDTEVYFNNYLSEKGYPVAKVIKNKDNELITLEDGWQAAIFEFKKGVEINSASINNNLAIDLAKVIAKLHKEMYNQDIISAENRFGCRISSVEGVNNQEIINKWKSLNNESKNINTNDFRKSLIHGDLTRENILTTSDKRHVDAIIDFGDSHNDYIAWDLAVLLTHIFITKTYGIDFPALKTFIDTYNYYLPLPKEESWSLIFFMKIRNLNLAIEVNSLQKIQPMINKDELISIENSALTKLEMIEDNKQKLQNILFR